MEENSKAKKRERMREQERGHPYAHEGSKERKRVRQGRPEGAVGGERGWLNWQNSDRMRGAKSEGVNGTTAALQASEAEKEPARGCRERDYRPNLLPARIQHTKDVRGRDQEKVLVTIKEEELRLLTGSMPFLPAKYGGQGGGVKRGLQRQKKGGEGELHREETEKERLVRKDH